MERLPGSMGALILWGALAVQGCGAVTPCPNLSDARALEVERQVLTFTGDEPNGLSGLTVIDGQPLAVAETDEAVCRLGAAAPERMPIEGAPEGVDLEAVAADEGGLFGGSRGSLLVGTESPDTERLGDSVLVLARAGAGAGEGFRLQETIELPYENLWTHVRAEGNHGAEALCVAGRSLFVGLENVRMEVDEERARVVRAAPIARRTAGEEGWTAGEVLLTSTTGKLSAFACRPVDGDRVQLFAVERHYATLRIVQVLLPATGPLPEDAAPLTVLHDLTGFLEGDPNLEGLAIDGEDFLLVVDNHYRQRTGPNELIRIRRGVPAFPAARRRVAVRRGPR